MNKNNVGRGGSGLKSLGMRNGRKWWEARLYWIDARTGKHHEKRVRFQADSRLLALQERERRLERARAGTETRGKDRPKFRQVAEESAAEIGRHSTRKTAESRNRTLCAHFGDYYVDMVSAREIADYLDACALKSVGQLRAAFGRIFRHAVRKHCIAVNPMRDVEMRRREVTLADVKPEPNRALTPEQVDLFFADLQELEPDLYPLVHVQYMLGCRFSEVSALRRDAIDLESGMVSIARGQYQGEEGPPKGNEARAFALPLESRAVLRAHLDRMAVEQWPGWQELVFPRPQWPQARRRASMFWASSTIDAKIRASFKRLGFSVKGTTHVARHTLITIAEELTPSEALLRKVVGHRSKRVHEGYQHAHQDRVVRLADAVGGALLRRTGTGSKTGRSGGDASSDPTKQG